MLFIKFLFIFYFNNNNNNLKLKKFFGDWGLGIGDWGLGSTIKKLNDQNDLISHKSIGIVLEIRRKTNSSNRNINKKSLTIILKDKEQLNIIEKRNKYNRN